MIVSVGPSGNYDDWRPDKMADQIPLAAAHPTEMWATLGVLTTALGGLVAVLYNRINKDIATTDDTIEAVENEVWQELDRLRTDMNELGKKVNGLAERVAQLSTAQAFTNEELDKICTDVKLIERSFTEIGVEHKHCMRLHQNLLGGDNAHHGSH